MPKFSVKYGNIFCKTPSFNLVVAALSKYTIDYPFFPLLLPADFPPPFKSTLQYITIFFKMQVSAHLFFVFFSLKYSRRIFGDRIFFSVRYFLQLVKRSVYSVRYKHCGPARKCVGIVRRYNQIVVFQCFSDKCGSLFLGQRRNHRA